MKIFINRPFTRIIFLLAICFSTIESKASHANGAEITYTCTSTVGILEVTLILYRNCDGGVALCPNTCGAACSPTIQMTGADATCSFTLFGNIALSLYSVRDVNPNPMCANTKNTCDNMGCVTPGTYSPGVERYEFKGLANVGPTSGIPASCCNIRFSWENCCRSGFIYTGSAGQGLYNYAIVNRCLSLSPCNGSPLFTNDPIPVICTGGSFIYNLGGTDLESDSLSYGFAPAMQDAYTTVTYNPPFAYDKPLTWLGSATGTFPAGIKCEPTTGNILFTPVNGTGSTFYGVMTVEIKQWKIISGVPTVIGIVRRDVLMGILDNCPLNNPPRLSTSPTSTPTSPKIEWEVCAGNQLCFDIIAKDTDVALPTVSDTTYLSWNSALASLGATFTPNYIDSTRKINGPREDSYKFCWTPTAAMASSTPYYFTVGAKDSRCPNPGLITRAFSVKVLSKANLSITKTYQGCGKWQVSYVNNNPSITPSAIEWAIAGDTIGAPPSMASQVFINVQTTPPVQFSKPGKYLIRLEATSAGPASGTPCSYIRYDTITVDTFLFVSANDTFTCYGDSVLLSASAQHGTGPYSYRWYNSINDTAGLPLNAPFYTNASLKVLSGTSRTYTVVARDLSGCKAIDSITVTVKPSLTGFTTTNVTCNGSNTGSITIKPTDTTTIYQYKLDSGTFQSSHLFTGVGAGMHTVLVQDSGGCSRTLTNISITQPSVLRDTLTSHKDESCYLLNNGSITSVAIGGTPPYQFKLDSGTYLGTSVFNNLQPGTYTIYVKDSKACTHSFTKTIAKADSLSYTFTKNNIPCFGINNGTIIVTVSGGKPPYQFKLGTGTFGFSGTFSGLAAGSYTIQIKDSNNCSKFLTTQITQPASPISNSVVPKNITCFGLTDGSVKILAIGGTTPYTYSVDSGVYDTATLKSNLAPGLHAFSIKDSLGCILNFNRFLSQPALLQYSTINTPVTCNGSTNGSIAITASGGTIPYTYSVDSGVYNTIANKTNLTTGLHAFSVKDKAGCILDFTETITEPLPISHSTTVVNASCYGHADGSITINATGGTPGYQYKIGVDPYKTGNVFSGLSAQEHSFTIKDSKGCENQFIDSVISPVLIVAGTVTGDTSVLKNSIHTYSIPAQSGLNYLWVAQKGTVVSGQNTPTAGISWDSVGTGNIFVTIYSAIDCGDTASLAVTIGTTGMAELGRQMGLDVFPNPTRNILNINIRTLPDHTQIELYDAQGKVVMEQPLKMTQQMNLESLSQGLYILKIGDWRGQVIKQ
jgi:hypothetical protein